MIHVDVNNRQSALTIDEDQLRNVISAVLVDEGVHHAEISLAVVDNGQIHDLNRRYLQHDYATDVLSFVLERSKSQLDGEIVVSAEMAIARCREFACEPLQELTLYIVHGALHLVGYDDTTKESADVMRQREAYHLSRAGARPASVKTPRQEINPRQDMPCESTRGGAGE